MDIPVTRSTVIQPNRRRHTLPNLPPKYSPPIDVPSNVSRLFPNAYELPSLQGGEFFRYDSTYIILIATDIYQDSSFHRLEKAVSDAESIRAAFSCHGAITFRRLYNQDATKASILRCFDDFANMLDKSLDSCVRLLCYIGCHGHKGQFRTPRNELKAMPYFVLYDTDQDHLRSTGLSMKELQELSSGLSAVHQFYMIDSCYAGDVLCRTRGGFARSLIGRQCCVALCSSTGNQQTIEDANGSVFAQSIVEEMTSPFLFRNTFSDKNRHVTLNSIVERIRMNTYHSAQAHQNDQLVVFGSLLPRNEGSILFFEDDHLSTQNKKREQSKSEDEECAIFQITDVHARPPTR